MTRSAPITNRTTGDSTSLTFNAPSGTSLVGNSAEWIVEAPTVGGQQSSLADYGEVFFSVCEAYIGPLFSGKYYVVEVRHRFDSQKGLRTEFTAERAGIGKG